METDFPRRLGDYEYSAVGYGTGRGTFIAKMSIWAAAGTGAISPSDFQDIGFFDSEEQAVRVATSSAEHWIRMQMLKPKG